MKLRDNQALRDEVRALVQGDLQDNPLVDAILGAVDRAITATGPGSVDDGYPRVDASPTLLTCSQCGKRFTARACGPTHAAVAAYRRWRWAIATSGKAPK